jgi:hypothetical protein
MATLLQESHEKATLAAAEAAQDFLDQHYGGQDQGACGFAWVTYYPLSKGNTRDGKEERRLMESIGFRKDYTGKAWQLWNPAQIGAQNVDAKMAGARAYADTLMAEVGIKVYPGDRLD